MSTVTEQLYRQFSTILSGELTTLRYSSLGNGNTPLNGECPYYINYTGNDYFKAAFNIAPFSGDDPVEVPIAVTKHLLNYRKKLLKKNVQESNGVLIQLSPTSDTPIVRSSMILVLKELLYKSKSRIKSVRYRKDNNIYYGNGTFIMDSDRDFLFLVTVMQSFTGVGSGREILYTNPKIYINPKVFKSQTGLNALIVKYLIPYFLDVRFELLGDYYKLSVLLEDPTPKFLVKPAEFKTADLSQDINNFLAGNKDLVTNIFKIEDL